MNRRVVGFDGRQHPWTLTGYMVRNDDIRPRSSYHLRCRVLLRQLYPTSPICEEVSLPGSGNLKLDFFLPHQQVGIEVQGEQHYQPVGKFHVNKSAFLAGLKRDSDKRRWCQLNNIRVIELRYDATDEQWATQILNG